MSKEKIKDAWSFGESAEEINFHPIKLSENHTYRVEKGEKKWILRITPKFHRNQESIESELSFILTLSENNLPVSAPVLTKANNYVISIPYQAENEEWWAVLFGYSPGDSCVTNWKGITDLHIVEEWGKVLGKLHQVAAANGFEVTNETSTQWKNVLANVPKWDETHTGALSLPRVAELANFHPVGAKLHKRWLLLREKMERLPKTNQTYGVLHGDLNVSNFFYSETEGIQIFDFDQFQMNFFAADVSVVVFGARFFERGWGGKPIEGFNSKAFLETFLKGYRSVKEIDQEVVDMFSEFRTLYQTSVALDIIQKFESGKQYFDDDIIYFVRVLVELFDDWPSPI